MFKVLRTPEVAEKTGKSRTTIWRDVRAGRFPAPIQLGPNAVGWIEGEIDAWLESLPRVAYAPTDEPPQVDG